MKTSESGLFFGNLLITDSVSLLLMYMFRFCTSPDLFIVGWKFLGIHSTLAGCTMYSCIIVHSRILWSFCIYVISIIMSSLSLIILNTFYLVSLGKGIFFKSALIFFLLSFYIGVYSCFTMLLVFAVQQNESVIYKHICPLPLPLLSF